jgi:hypothetical protein
MDQRSWHQATVMEAKLDSICLALGKMKATLQKAQVLDHMTEKERAELEAALARAEERLGELSTVIRGGA